MEIKIRPLVVDDIDIEYCRWYENNDGHLNFFTGSGRIFNLDVLLSDFKEGIKSSRWFYYIIENDSGEKIGNVKIGPIDLINKTSDLVCLIGNRNYIGKGISSKAIAAANLIAFEEHDIRRLQSGMYASNISSIKAYTRANWVIEGISRGFYLLNGVSEDRVCVACLNPRYFSKI